MENGASSDAFWWLDPSLLRGSHTHIMSTPVDKKKPIRKSQRWKGIFSFFVLSASLTFLSNIESATLSSWDVTFCRGVHQCCLSCVEGWTILCRSARMSPFKRFERWEFSFLLRSCSFSYWLLFFHTCSFLFLFSYFFFHRFSQHVWSLFDYVWCLRRTHRTDATKHAGAAQWRYDCWSQPSSYHKGGADWSTQCLPPRTPFKKDSGNWKRENINKIITRFWFEHFFWYRLRGTSWDVLLGWDRNKMGWMNQKESWQKRRIQ